MSQILPRLIRYRNAPQYLGMDKNRFNREVRPMLTTIPIGTQGVAFDRLEIDAWVDHYKRCNGRPGQLTGELTWDKEKPLASKKEAKSGISTRSYVESEYAKVLGLDQKPKRKSTSHSVKRRSGDVPN